MAFNTIFPIFLSNPALEVGIPVSRANFCLACVIPKARFQENESSGIPVFVFRFAMFIILLYFKFMELHKKYCAVPFITLFLCQQMPDFTYPKHKRRSKDNYYPIFQLQSTNIKEVLQHWNFNHKYLSYEDNTYYEK